MNKYVASIFFILVSAFSNAGEVIVESSTSLDLTDVSKLLTRVERLVDHGINIVELYNFTASTPIDSERSKELSVIYKGNRYRLVYRVYMDGIDAPSIYWFAASLDLIREIDRETDALFEQLGN